MKSSLRAIIIAISITILLAVAIPSSAQFQPSISTKLDNSWRWLPASGNVASYQVEKFTLGEWILVDNIPAVVGEDGYVHTVIISLFSELYKIKVTAIDAAGNHGAESPESDWLLVFIPTPGRPEPE